MDASPRSATPPVFRSPNPLRRSAGGGGGGRASAAALDPLYFNPTPPPAAAAAAALPVAAAEAAVEAASEAAVRLRPARSRAARRARQERYKTQPVTFQEIAEVDEEVSPRCAPVPQALQPPPRPEGLEAPGAACRFDFLAPPSPIPGVQSKSMESLNSR